MEFTVKRSRRKTLAIEITRDAKVLVRSPMNLSQKEIDRFIKSHGDWIESHLERRRGHNSRYPEPTAEELARLKELAKEYLPRRVWHYAALTGLWPSAVRVTSARTRFGSCSAKNSVCLSYRLMEYPEEAIDYVVVHELAHIRYKNHGAEFYALIESVLPDYRERRALLRRR